MNPVNQPIQSQPATGINSTLAMPSVPQKASKKLIPGVVAIALIAVAAFGIFTVINSKNKQEIQAGKDYLSAIQSNDTAVLQDVVEPAVASVGTKIGKLGGPQAKQAFYKSYSSSALKAADGIKGEPTKVSVTDSSGGSGQYTTVIYKVGGKYVTVAEMYQDSKPKVIIAESGVKYYTPAKLQSQYGSYKQTMQQMDKMVDKIAVNSGPNAKQTLQAIFSVN